MIPVSLQVHLRCFKTYKSGAKPSGDIIEHMLNEYGAEGYELVSVQVEGQSYTYAFFKRLKQKR